MNPDFALVLNFKLSKKENVDPDFLVKTARNIGARAVSGSELLKGACSKYTIFLAKTSAGQNLTAASVIDAMATNRKNGKPTTINIPVNNTGKFDEATEKLLKTINDWMHMFGHAFNEGKESALTVDQDGFVLENRHAPYQKYVFLEHPLPEQITVTGLDQEPNRVEWIEKRVDLDFNFKTAS